MTTPIPRRGMALVNGPAYDLDMVMAAYETLIDALAARFGGTTVTAASVLRGTKFDWPDPGKPIARRTWKKMTEFYDVVDEALVHHMGPLTVKAFLLGKTWCVYDPLSRRVLTSQGDDISMLDPVPTVCLYGPEDEDQPGSYGMPPVSVIDAASVVIDDELAKLGLTIDRSRPVTVPGESFSRCVAFVAFPHDIYGRGRDYIRVRCVTPDGDSADSGEEGN